MFAQSLNQYVSLSVVCVCVYAWLSVHTHLASSPHFCVAMVAVDTVHGGSAGCI